MGELGAPLHVALLRARPPSRGCYLCWSKGWYCSQHGELLASARPFDSTTSCPEVNASMELPKGARKMTLDAC